MRRFLARTSPLIALFLVGCGASTATRDGSVIPLKRVRLYETGVGYFERSGSVGAEVASLPVPSGHLDDALKTLVVLGKSNEVGGIAFDSRQSPAVARARARLPADTMSPIGFEAILESLVGESVELDDGEDVVTGRLVDLTWDEVLRKSPLPSQARDAVGEELAPDEPSDPESGDDELVERLVAVLLTGSDAFVRMEVPRLVSVRPLDPEVRERYDQALEAQAKLAGTTENRLDVFGGFEGPITLGYLAETPVWRTSYRLVFSDQQAVLSGWALVHNDTEEDWRSVEVEFANGRPDSFLFPLGAPRYERRELVTPHDELSSVPQLLTETPDAMWGDFVGEGIGLGSIGTVGHGGGTGSGYGYGSGHGRLGRVSAGSSGLLKVGDLSEIAQATGEEAPTVFVYKSTKLLDLESQRSALVPFLQRPIEAEIITWFDGMSNGSGRFAIRFANSGGNMLPGGPLSVFADGGFAGETMIERMAPGERRFAPIAEDLDVEIDITRSFTKREPKRLVLNGDRFEEHYLRRREFEFTLSSRSSRPRAVHIAVGASTNVKLEGADRVDFDAERSDPIAVFELGAKVKDQAETLTVTEGLVDSTNLSDLTSERLEELADKTSIPQDERDVVREAAKRQAAVEEKREELEDVAQEIEVVMADIDRLRGHLEAMAEQPAGADNQLLTRLLAAEDQLAELRRREQREQDELARLEKAVREALSVLTEEKPQLPPEP